MLKRNALISCILLVSLFLFGCQTEEQPNFQESNEPQGEVIEVEEEPYRIVRESYVKQDISIEYPQVEGLDSERQEAVNTILRDDALSSLNIYGEDTENLHIDIDYKITFEGENFLSAYFFGLGYIEGAAHPNNHFATSNIDLRSGERVHLNEAFNIDEDFVGEFLEDDTFQAADSEQEDQIFKDYVAENLTAKLEEADYRKSEPYAEIECYSYFTKERLGLSFIAPHALGGHIEYEALYSELDDSIKLSHSIWEDLGVKD